MSTLAQKKKALQMAVCAELLWNPEWRARYGARAAIDVANGVISRWVQPGTRVPRPEQTDLIWKLALDKQARP